MQAVERSLDPFLESITIAPSLINTILHTPVSESWVEPIVELDSRLGAIRSGPRVQSRFPLDQVAEALRLKVSRQPLSAACLATHRCQLTLPPRSFTGDSKYPGSLHQDPPAFHNVYHPALDVTPV